MEYFRPCIKNNAIDTTVIAVIGTSAVTLLNKGGGLHIRNVGVGTCFISFGDKNCAATANHMPIPAGTDITIRRPNGEYLAAISGTTTTLHVTIGDLA